MAEVCLWGLPTLTCGHSRVTGAAVGRDVPTRTAWILERVMGCWPHTPVAWLKLKVEKSPTQSQALNK